MFSSPGWGGTLLFPPLCQDEVSPHCSPGCLCPAFSPGTLAASTLQGQEMVLLSLRVEFAPQQSQQHRAAPPATPRVPLAPEAAASARDL